MSDLEPAAALAAKVSKPYPNDSAEYRRDLVRTCMAEYDLTGWTVPDLINPDDVSWPPKQ